MGRMDLFNNVEVVRGISPQLYENGVNPPTVTIDTLGYESCTLIMLIGAATDNQTVTVQHSDDDAAYDNITADHVIADADNTAEQNRVNFLTTGTADHQVKVLGLRGTRRFIQVDGDGSGATGANFAVCAILGHPQNRPVDRS